MEKNSENLVPMGDGEVIHRDNSRFQFLYPNGKPKLPEGFAGTLKVQTTYELAKEREAQRAIG